MEVELRFYNLLQKHHQGPNKKEVIFMQLAEGTTVGRLIEKLGMQKNEIGLIVVNHEIVTADTRLRDKDRVSLSPPVSGG